MPSERIFWTLRSAKRLYVLIDDSENIEKSEKCIEESEIMSDIRSCSWETEFIIIDWLSISMIVKANIESVTEGVSTEYISVEDTEDY